MGAVARQVTRRFDLQTCAEMYQRQFPARFRTSLAVFNCAATLSRDRGISFWSLTRRGSRGRLLPDERSRPAWLSQIQPSCG